MTRRFLLLGMALILGLPAGAQQQGAQQQGMQPPAAGGAQSQAGRPQTARPQGDVRSRISSRTDLVIVPVTVKDGDGRLVGDLEKSEFRVFEDGVEQQIILFDSDPFPLSAVVLIDDDLPQKAAAQVQKSLITISAGFGPGDEVALATYAEFPETVSDFSFSNDQLFTQLKRLELGSRSTAIVADPTTAGPVINGRPLPTGTGVPLHGSARPANNVALHDAVYAAGQMLRGRGRNRRKIIFLISDGSNSRHNQHTFDETLRTLLAADVSVYSISVTRSLPIGQSILQRGANELEKYAVDTGGDTYFASKQQDLERLYSDVTEQARNQYTLTFEPHGGDRSRDYHTIEVRVRRPGLNILARQGYYQSAMTPGR